MLLVALGCLVGQTVHTLSIRCPVRLPAAGVSPPDTLGLARSATADGNMDLT
jgi:hypothetical protein